MRALVIAVLFFGAAVRADAGQRAIRFDCAGLEAYDFSGTHDVDWAWGNIRAKDGSVVIGFSLGLMVGELVSEERPAGFRTFKTERIGNVALTHGHNVRQKQYQATLIGAPISLRVNLSVQPNDRDRLLVLARRLATAQCRVTISDSPSN